MRCYHGVIGTFLPAAILGLLARTALPAEEVAFATGPQGFYRDRGFDVSARGDIYVLHHGKHRVAGECFVTRFGPDGKVVKKGLVEITGPSVGGIQLDRQGNIYVGVAVELAAQKEVQCATED